MHHAKFDFLRAIRTQLLSDASERKSRLAFCLKTFSVNGLYVWDIISSPAGSTQKQRYVSGTALAAQAITPIATHF